MKKYLITILAMLTASAMTLFVYFYFADEAPYADHVIVTKIPSAFLQEDREVIVHLPRDYDSTAKYPVMYVLDGGSDDQHIASKFEVLSVAGYAPKTIVVGIPNMSNENRQSNLTPPFMRMDNDDVNSAAGNADPFLSFLESELIPYVDQHYATSGQRMLSGNSRGGLLVMYSLLYKPDLFQARFCYSTPFWRQDAIMVRKVNDFLATRDTMNTFLYMSAGEAETANIKEGLHKMDSMLKTKAAAGFVWHTSYTPNAIHQDNGRISSSAGIARWSEYIKDR